MQRLESFWGFQLLCGFFKVWIYENITMRLEGLIVGFDEYMNLVLDDAEEFYVKTQDRKPLGRIMLKGDNITLIQSIETAPA